MDRFRPTGKVSKKNGPIFPIEILVEWIVPNTSSHSQDNFTINPQREDTKKEGFQKL